MPLQVFCAGNTETEKKTTSNEARRVRMKVTPRRISKGDKTDDIMETNRAQYSKVPSDPPLGQVETVSFPACPSAFLTFSCYGRQHQPQAAAQHQLLF
jgi:hypothetical protein